MRGLDKIQYLMNRYYSGIIFSVALAVFGLVAYGLFYQIEHNNQNLIEREQQVAEILEQDQAITQSIKDETEAQTKIINRQFRALCVVVIEVVGQPGLNRLDDETKQQCERLADNPEQTEETAVEQQERHETAPKE